jgi:hypothetical protein
MDLMKLIDVWLANRKLYVKFDGQTSCIYPRIVSTIKDILLYFIYIPYFDKTPITNFADDNKTIKFNFKINSLIPKINMGKKLEMIVKWLKDSGLKVNKSKTELCLFQQNDTPK